MNIDTLSQIASVTKKGDKREKKRKNVTRAKERFNLINSHDPIEFIFTNGPRSRENPWRILNYTWILVNTTPFILIVSLLDHRAVAQPADLRNNGQALARQIINNQAGVCAVREIC